MTTDAQEVIDIDSDGSDNEEDSEFNTFESSASYHKVSRSNFFSRLNNTVKDDEDAPDKIWVQSIDWQIKENKVEHHTDQYDNKRLILRRGKQFIIKLKFDKDFNEEKHFVTLTFYTGDKPCISEYLE